MQYSALMNMSSNNVDSSCLNKIVPLYLSQKINTNQASCYTYTEFSDGKIFNRRQIELTALVFHNGFEEFRFRGFETIIHQRAENIDVLGFSREPCPHHVVRASHALDAI